MVLGSVSVGNPGRWGAPDNVFNHPLAETIACASAIVGSFGLPSFSGEHVRLVNCSVRDAKLGLFDAWTGAVMRELHVTRNYATGGESVAKDFMVWAGAQRSARIAKGIYGDETVVYGSLARKGRPLHKAIVVYRKAEEMLAHARGAEASRKLLWRRGCMSMRVTWGWCGLSASGAGIFCQGAMDYDISVGLVWVRWSVFLSGKRISY